MKNVVFDLGGVVLTGKARNVLDKLDLNENEYNELVKFFDDWNDMDTTDMSIEEKLDKFDCPESIKNKYKDSLLKYYELRDFNMNLINLMKKIKENNNNVYVLSDNNKDASLYFKKVLKDVDGFMFSYEYKTIKKDGKLFDIFLDKFNLDPCTCYFIDDTEENIQIAESKGINGRLYTNDEDIISYLKERGIINE